MVPKGWQKKRLGDLFDLSSGKRPTFVDEGNVPVYGGNGVMGVTDVPLVESTTVVIGRVGSTGAIHTTKGEAWISDNALYVSEYLEETDLDFLAALLEKEKLEQYATRTSHPSLSQRVILSVPVHVPPVREQGAIANILTSADDAIAATRAVIDQTRRVKKGLLQTLMTRGIGHNRFKKSEIGEIPDTWDVSTVGDEFEMQLGKMLNKKARKGPDQRPYVGNAAVQWGTVNISDLPTMHFNESERAKFRLRKGDLLVCEGGEVGRTAIWNGELQECYYQKAIHRLRPVSDCSAPFMRYYMRCAAETGRFSDYASRTSISHLTQEKLARLPIPVPPRFEQDQIANAIQDIDRAISSWLDSLSALSLLKRGLMQDLLTGRVRVPVD